MNYINFNGKLIEDQIPIVPANNRGLRYGDGVFETLKIKNGQIVLSTPHLDRLWQGMQLLQFDIPKLFTPQKIVNEILALAKKNKLKTARVRLTIFRGAGGIYDAVDHYPNYIIETWPLPEFNGQLNENGIALCLYKNAVKSIDAFSNCKTNNYLPYFMGALFAKTMKCNDALILNNKGGICDTTIANIFYIKDAVFYTPALNQGCVAGVMRHWLISKIRELNYTVIEKEVSEKDVATADEVFLTNAIYNIRWVSIYGDKHYGNEIIQKITIKFLQHEAEIFC